MRPSRRPAVWSLRQWIPAHIRPRPMLSARLSSSGPIRGAPKSNGLAGVARNAGGTGSLPKKKRRIALAAPA